jgi:hypothetical protein
VVRWRARRPARAPVTGRVLAADGRAPPAEPVVPVALAGDPPGGIEPAPAAAPVAPAELVAAAAVEAGLGGGGGAGRAVDG